METLGQILSALFAGGALVGILAYFKRKPGQKEKDDVTLAEGTLNIAKGTVDFVEQTMNSMNERLSGEMAALEERLGRAEGRVTAAEERAARAEKKATELANRLATEREKVRKLAVIVGALRREMQANGIPVPDHLADEINL